VAAAAASAVPDTRLSRQPRAIRLGWRVCWRPRTVLWRRGGQRWRGVWRLQTPAAAVEEVRTLGVTAWDKTGAGSAGRRSVLSVRPAPRVVCRNATEWGVGPTGKLSWITRFFDPKIQQKPGS